MSDLQISLLIIGAVVVGGVYLFNWFQERQLRRKLERAFSDEREDVLLDSPGREEKREPRLAAGDAAERIEPQLNEDAAGLEREEAAVEPQAPIQRAGDLPLPPVPGLDEAIDFVAAIDAQAPIPGAAIDELLGKCAAFGKPCQGAGFNEASGEWEELARGAGKIYSRVRLGLQLVNRTGPVNAAQLAAFCDAVRVCAGRAGATAACPDIDAGVAAARDLDSFCADADIAIGINIVAREGDHFSGTKIRAHAEAAGFKLEPDGVFRYRNEQRETLFTLDNHEPAPFLPEQVKNITTRGITLLLDVPRVADGAAVLEKMYQVGRALATALGARMVDDNRAPLNEAGIARISHQLAAIQQTMQARGIGAGSERALRLFS